MAVLRPQKALSVLLEAHAHVLKALPETHLFIAGDGECGPSLVQLAGRLGIEDRVHFLGRRRDVDALLRAADVAAISSDYEGTPLVAFECMANHTPLVATSVGGLLDIVRDGETGVLVPPRDPRALGEALAGLLADPARGKRLAGAAAARLHEFTIEAIAERFGTLYETLVAESGTRVSDQLVLCYHAVSPTWQAELSVTPEALERQIAFFTRRGWHATTFTAGVLSPEPGPR